MKRGWAAGGLLLLGVLAMWWGLAAARVPAPPDPSGQPSAVVLHLAAAYRRARMWPRSAEALGALGMAYHADLLPDRAAQAYERAALLDPRDWRWPYYLALVETDHGNTEAAVGRLHDVVSLQPDLALAWWRLGEAEFKRGRFDAAIAAADHALASRAGWAPAWPGGRPARPETIQVSAYASLSRARSALALDDFHTAARVLEALVAANPRFSAARRLLADAADRLGHSDEAEHQRRLASRSRAATAPIDPMIDALAEASRSSTFLLKEAGITDLRVDGGWREHLVRLALDADPSSPEVVYELATVLHQRGRHGEALVQFQRYRGLVPGDDQVLTQIGRCLGDVGRFNEGETWLRRALEWSDDAVTLYDLGFVLEGQGRAAEAMVAYRRALARDPNHAPAHTNLAAMLAQQGRTREALAHFVEAARVTPDDPDAHNNLGSVLAQIGQRDRAHAELLATIALEPKHADAHANLGVLLLRDGRADEARRHFEAALEANPNQRVARVALGR